MKEGFVKKEENEYMLTSKGKEYANRMDLGDTFVENQAKISVVLTCIRNIDEEEEYLLYTRRKSPFYGFQGFPTGKVRRGEDILEAASRELKEETDLLGKPKLYAIRHYRIHSKDKKLLEDVIFFACRFDNPTGELKSNVEGDFVWVNKKDIWKYLKKPVREIKELVTYIDSEVLSFKEDSYVTEGF